MKIEFIKRGMDLLTGVFFYGKGLGKFRSKQFGCIKRMDLLSVELLSGFYYTLIYTNHSFFRLQSGGVE